MCMIAAFLLYIFYSAVTESVSPAELVCRILHTLGIWHGAQLVEQNSRSSGYPDGNWLGMTILWAFNQCAKNKVWCALGRYLNGY